MRKPDPPTYLFWLLEVAVNRGDVKAAARARRALRRRGFQVALVRHNTDSVGHGRREAGR